MSRNLLQKEPGFPNPCCRENKNIQELDCGCRDECCEHIKYKCIICGNMFKYKPLTPEQESEKLKSMFMNPIDFSVPPEKNKE